MSIIIRLLQCLRHYWHHDAWIRNKRMKQTRARYMRQVKKVARHG